MIPTIFCYVNGRYPEVVGDLLAVALAEDGDVLTEVMGPSEDGLRDRLGAGRPGTTPRAYFDKYPHGFLVEWVDFPCDDSRFAAAILSNIARYGT